MNPMLATWLKVVTNPGKRIFDQQVSISEFNFKTGLSWLITGLVCSALIRGIGTCFYEFVFRDYIGWRALTLIAILPNIGFSPDLDMTKAVASFTSSPIVGGIFAASGLLIESPIIFGIGSGISFGLARLLGGRGNFGVQIFASATFIPPLMIVAACLAFYRPITALMFPMVLAYTFAPSFFSVRVIHAISTVKSWLVVVPSFLVSTILMFVLSVLHF